MRFEFNPEMVLLLLNESDDLVTMHYIDHSWTMQKIGPRPPFYTNPVYKSDFPLI
ncbi:hypothetical protein [Alkalihalobacillus sp. 1P02AB]|uniref:hypothetical protein n=1 Tax=Alkalihalobacillus sp. 1P02AB TaxID=3132260 RepID=UPI0039A6E268